MGMIRFTHKGDFSKTMRFLKNANQKSYAAILQKYGEAGVRALAAHTPRESGDTAAMWGYDIVESGDGARIYWTNRNINDGVNIALILQYGHGTGTGGYVQGRDYINPALQPIFDQMADEAWREVTGS